jgi:lysozyme family protein
MSNVNFDPAFTELMVNEGGYVNNPADPGGETMYGITKRVAEKHGYTGDMRDLPIEFAKSIAKSDYWDSIHGDDLPPGLDFQVFDACYNSGATTAIEWLQKAVRINADGRFGPATLAAVQHADPLKVIMRFDAYRLLFLDSLPTWPNFGRGWARRIANNLLIAAA